ncbi:MAG: DUF3592 domain-containing protein [Lachnospiraceae bacterium]|nr:DUF3592 domain-containing protein [Lachnospiraceae bacterium]
MKKHKIMYLPFIIFTVVGIGLLVGSIFYYMYYSNFKSTAEEVIGEISRIETYYDSDHDLSHHVYVSYTYDGIYCEDVSIGSYNSSMYKGKEITLLCDPENPYHIMEKSSGAIVGIILAGMGAIFGAVGIVPMVVTIRKNKQKKQILLNGQVLHAVVESVDYNRNYSVNGRHPYVIYCAYRDEYKDISYRFKSENLWTDPSIVFSPGSFIDVYVDPNNYSKYYVNAEQALEQRVVDFT